MPDPTIPTPTASPTMSSQHRATPAQWATLHLVDPFDDTASCLLELRARVEALEAAANNRQHGKSAERAEPGPAASLVERVASAIYDVPHDPKAEARAAIREVAWWLRSEYPAAAAPGIAWANLIEEEANR